VRRREIKNLGGFTIVLIGLLILTYYAAANAASSPDVVINEVDCDTPGTDDHEFVELYDGGAGNTALDGLVVVFYNGNNDASYNSFDLDGYSTDGDGYFLLGNSGVTPTPSITFDNGSLQNGADAVAIYTGDATDFPNDTPVTTTNLLDAIVYDTNDADDPGLLILLNAGQPQVNEDGAGDKDNHSNQRCPNGSGGARNTDTYIQATPTPGADNNCPPPVATNIIINEVDCDTLGTDTLEFVELYDGGAGNTALDGLVVVFYNGGGDVSYDAFDLDGYSTDSDGYFLLGNSGVTPTPSITFGNGSLQNGADAVAIYIGNVTDFPDGTLVTTTNRLDAIVYDTNDVDDPGLLILLNAGQPQVNEDGAGDKDNHSNQRCPNGSGGQQNTSSYTQNTPTPGGANNCANNPPTANAGPDQTVQTGDTVQLDGSGSSDPDSDPLSYSWSFVSKPAGSAAVFSDPTIINPIFVADVAGDYILELTVDDGRGGSDTDQVTITAHAPPTADFTYSPEQPTTWDTIQFTDQSSDSDGTVVAWVWNFGDGGSSNEQNPTHRYRLPGTYPGTLEVTDNDGLNGTTVREVEVALGLGDVDGSGTVDVLDVRLCLQIATGILEGTAEQRTAADVDEDGDVDRTDAEILAEYVIGL